MASRLLWDWRVQATKMKQKKGFVDWRIGL